MNQFLSKAILISSMFFIFSCKPESSQSKKTTSQAKSKQLAAANSSGKGAIAGQKSLASNFVNSDLALNTDQSTADCQPEVLQGWKCLYTSVTTTEGKTYKIAIKWSRPVIDSVGTVLLAVGGSGRGESRLDPPSKAMMDELDKLDNIRVIQLEFIDQPTSTNTWGGYFHHFGGYKSAGLAFKESLDLILAKGLVKGSFLNYMGGSNGSTVIAYAMSHYGVDQYFDRVVFQMGPFLPDLAHACDPGSASSFYLNTPDQQRSVFSLINYWNYGDANKSVCDHLDNDRTSILKGANSSFPNTHLHVIVGAKEVTDGFGAWILASNLEWYNGIQAKSKNRIIRPDMAHNNSYQDMRRYLRLAPHEVALEDAVANCTEKKGTFQSNGQTVEWLCKDCNQTVAPPADPAHGTWNYQGSGCYHRVLNAANHCSSGQFCSNGKVTQWTCHCGVMASPWVSQGQECYHKATTNSCSN